MRIFENNRIFIILYACKKIEEDYDEKIEYNLRG